VGDLFAPMLQAPQDLQAATERLRRYLTGV